MVSVSRVYEERGNPERYPVEYFSELSTIGAWRRSRNIRLDHNRWKDEVEQRQRMLAAAGEPFTVSRISDSIEIRFVVPVNQNPPFEEWNANLTGSVVEQTGDLRVIERDVLLLSPIGAQSAGRKRFAAPLALEIRTTYAVSRETPLLPEVEPVDPVKAIEAIRYLKPRGEFTVMEVRVHHDAPWYRVRTRVGEGWINSTALVGQELTIIR